MPNDCDAIDDLLAFRGEVSDAAIAALVALLIDNDKRDQASDGDSAASDCGA